MSTIKRKVNTWVIVLIAFLLFSAISVTVALAYFSASKIVGTQITFHGSVALSVQGKTDNDGITSEGKWQHRLNDDSLFNTTDYTTSGQPVDNYELSGLRAKVDSDATNTYIRVFVLIRVTYVGDTAPDNLGSINITTDSSNWAYQGTTASPSSSVYTTNESTLINNSINTTNKYICKYGVNVVSASTEYATILDDIVVLTKSMRDIKWSGATITARVVLASLTSNDSNAPSVSDWSSAETASFYSSLS